ncbi:hypothetical protein M427DRAFT_42920 [Gonapodya prolifera JEL478]|uniref:Cullin family profile domain-containing protein n=1 Tax=Gonapodya prolifera (strain JEL478) TaxID=1344416 RepID=A0A139AL22_GONPJ|nr:hypothetical protein M427DRAFT_42920 [Gonapodya prolifera JEL478]|eukprot:KXS17502.1 hypothetical protein M427DRAFT_42920 [Gonapodya prolifera JEL478]
MNVAGGLLVDGTERLELAKAWLQLTAAVEEKLANPPPATTAPLSMGLGTTEFLETIIKRGAGPTLISWYQARTASFFDSKILPRIVVKWSALTASFERLESESQKDQQIHSSKGTLTMPSSPQPATLSLPDSPTSASCNPPPPRENPISQLTNSASTNQDHFLPSVPSSPPVQHSGTQPAPLLTPLDRVAHEFGSSVEELCTYLEKCLGVAWLIVRMNTPCYRRLHNYLQTHFRLRLLSHFGPVADKFYNYAFRAGPHIGADRAHHTTGNLVRIGLGEAAERALVDVVCAVVEQRVARFKFVPEKVAIEGRKRVEEGIAWVRKNMVGFVESVAGGDVVDHHDMVLDGNGFDNGHSAARLGEGKNDRRQKVDKWRRMLEAHYYRCFCEMRIKEMFDIVVDWPKSQDYLQDLKRCLEETHMEAKFVRSYRAAIQRRFLHIAASTSNIVFYYNLTIDALRNLDPTSAMLDQVTAPIRRYLRSRPDTIRTIIDWLTEHQDKLPDPVLNVGTEDLGADDKDWDDPKWKPESAEAARSAGSDSVRKLPDAVAILLSIYESRELFAKEFQSTLCFRLLRSASYDTAQEVRNLEHLKLRVGEQNFQMCDVMIKDIEESRRIDNTIQERMPPNLRIQEVHASILSRMFWPSLRIEDCPVPPEIQEACENYARIFKDVRKSRKLVWYPSPGAVEVEIVTNTGVTVTKTIPAFHATILYHFQEQETWTLEELAEKIETEPALLRRKINYLIGSGLILETSPDTFVFKEDQPKPEKDQGPKDDQVAPDADESFQQSQGDVSMAASEDPDGDTSMEDPDPGLVMHSTIAMLTNNGSMTVEQVATRFQQAFFMHVSLGLLERVLEDLVNSERVEKSVDGTYSIRR